MSNWNEDKLDKGDEAMKEDFARLEGQIKGGFAESDKRFVRLEDQIKESAAVSDKRLARLETQIVTPTGALLVGALTIIAALIGIGS